MDLQELKIRLKINDESQDEFLQVALDDAIDYAQRWCNNQFLDENGELNLPPAVKQAVAKLVKAYQENSNVASQSLGDMSKSFFEGATMREAEKYLRPYKRVRFI